MKKRVPDFRPGDTVRVAVRIVEGDKERIQHFEGVCIARHGGGMDETFTVRRVSFGVGIERVFPLHSPRVEKISVIRQGRVRQSKLYYLRELKGRKARIRETRRKRDPKNQMVQLLHEVEPEPMESPTEAAQQPPEPTPEGPSDRPAQ